MDIFTMKNYLDEILYASITNDNVVVNSIKMERYIINENATIIFWSDGSKTISKRHKEDEFDKELGFLFAYFYKRWGNNNSAKKRVLNCINYENIKTFLFEFFAKDTNRNVEQARKYLKNLKISK